MSMCISTAQAQSTGREISVRHFPCKFLHKMALVKCPCAFWLRRLAQNIGREISVRHFPYTFLHKMALVKCPCAFWLRRLAQNIGREISVRHFPCKFLHKMALVKCPCAFWLRRLAVENIKTFQNECLPRQTPSKTNALTPKSEG